MKKLRLLLLSIICVLFISSCEDPDSSPKALLNLLLVDSPASWDSVFVEIKGVDIEVMVEGRETQTQTFFLEYKSGDKRVKVSELVGGNTLLVGRSELPVGQITKATIVLGEDHSMFFDEKEYVLALADGSSSQIILPTAIDTDQGVSYDIILDLDLEKSIVQVSESPLTYELDPIFKLIKGAGTIELSGNLKPVSLYPAIYLFNEKDSFSTHINTSGNFLFRVPMDKYQVFMDPKNELYQDTTFNLDLTADLDSVLKNITFKLKP